MAHCPVFSAVAHACPSLYLSSSHADVYTLLYITVSTGRLESLEGTACLWHVLTAGNRAGAQGVSAEGGSAGESGLPSDTGAV